MKYKHFVVILFLSILLMMGLQINIVNAGSTSEEFTKNFSSSDFWAQHPNMTEGKHYAAQQVVGDKLVVIGGNNLSNVRTKTVEIYNITDDTWYVGAECPVAVYAVCSATIGDLVYILGADYNLYEKTYAYNVTSNTWSAALADMPNAYVVDGWTAVVNDGVTDVIYCLGGWDGGGGTLRKWVQVYCPNNDTWIQKTESLYGAPWDGAYDEVNRKIYTFSQFLWPWNNSGIVFGNSSVYDVDTDSWEMITSVPDGRVMNTLSRRVADGKVFLLSFMNDLSIPTSTYCYHIANSSYTQYVNFTLGLDGYMSGNCITSTTNDVTYWAGGAYTFEIAERVCFSFTPLHNHTVTLAHIPNIISSLTVNDIEWENYNWTGNQLQINNLYEDSEIIVYYSYGFWLNVEFWKGKWYTSLPPGPTPLEVFILNVAGTFQVSTLAAGMMMSSFFVCLGMIGTAILKRGSLKDRSLASATVGMFLVILFTIVGWVPIWVTFIIALLAFVFLARRKH